MSTLRVLHVLPHAGAGAQTYIDVLARMEGYAFRTFELSASRSPASAATSIAGRLPRLVRAARSADLIHLHGEAASMIALPLLRARPSVVTLHGLHLLRRLAPGPPQRLGRAAVWAIVAAAGRTICVSQAEFDELAWMPGRLRAKLALVRNGLPLPAPVSDHAREQARTELGLDRDTIAVLYLGQLEPRKDPLTAAGAVALARVRDHRIVLLIAGSGPCETELRAFAATGTTLLGQRGDVAELLAAADLFVMPSRREGLSYAVLEALAHGVATVVSDGPGNPEAVGEAGIVFTAGDVAALAAILLELAAAPGRRAELGRAGRARIASELSAERMLVGTRAVYEQALRAPGRAHAGAHA